MLGVLRLLKKVLRQGVEVSAAPPGDEVVLLVFSGDSGDCEGLNMEGLSPSGFTATPALEAEESPSSGLVAPAATVELLLTSERRFRFRRKLPLSNIFSQFGSSVQ